MHRLCLAVALLIAVPAGAAEPAKQYSPRDIDALPATPGTTLHYGPGPLQTGELRLPPGKGPFPVAIVVHGGCWTRSFGATLRNTAPLATLLAAKGIASWNIEYAQVGDPGGGWPGTFRDWAAAADHLRELAKTHPLDLAHVVATGHSAGAHAALWLAARHKLPASSEVRGADPIKLVGAVAIDGPGDIAPFVGLDAEICGKPVIAPLMGGTPAERPARYAEASPFAQLPLGVPQLLVASTVLSPPDAETYRAAAAAKGDTVTVQLPKDAGHFGMIAPGTAATEAVADAIVALAKAPLR